MEGGGLGLGLVGGGRGLGLEGGGWGAWMRGQRRGGRDTETPHSDYATGLGCLGPGPLPSLGALIPRAPGNSQGPARTAGFGW